MSGLTDEQRRRMEENRRKALEKRTTLQQKNQSGNASPSSFQQTSLGKSFSTSHHPSTSASVEKPVLSFYNTSQSTNVRQSNMYKSPFTNSSNMENKHLRDQSTGKVW